MLSIENEKTVESKQQKVKPCKIAISSSGKNIEDEVAHSFSSSPYFIVPDEYMNSYSILENPMKHLGATAGVETAKMLIDVDIDIVITGNIGPTASKTLESAGIRVHSGCSGKVSEALRKCLSGRLIFTKGANYSGCLESPGTSKVKQ